MSIVATLVLTLVVAAPVPEADPDTLSLFATDPDYRAAAGVEVRFEGELQFVPGVGGRPGRFQFLVPEAEGKGQTHELYLPRAVPDLGSFVGQPVRLTARATEKGLWPGKIERRQVAGGPGRDGVLARTVWQPSSAQRIHQPAQTFVFRRGEQVAALLPLTGGDPARAASEILAQRLRVPEIDWNKQMVVCVSLGLRGDVEGLTITRALSREGVLTVYYRLQRAAPGANSGFGYPAETALLPRFDGTVRFQEEGPPRPGRPDE